MNMNTKILLLASFVFGSIFAKDPVIMKKSRSVMSVYSNGESGDLEKKVVTVDKQMSDGTNTVEVIEYSPEGKELTRTFDVSFNKDFKEIGYVAEVFNKDIRVDDIHPMADVNRILSYGSSLFRDRGEKLLLLLVKQHGINFQDIYFGATPLILAVRSLSPKAVERILSFSDVDVNLSMIARITALHLAAVLCIWKECRCLCNFEAREMMEILKLLLAIPGINLDAKTSEGHTALDLARLAGNTECEKLLQEAMAKSKKS